MTTATHTTIKTTKDGREVTYSAGAIYLAGKLIAPAHVVTLSAAERRAAGAAITAAHTHRCGAVVLTTAEAAAVETAEAAYRASQHTPANVERARIASLYAAAERAEDDPSDHFRLLGLADAALATWQAANPEAAREERRSELRAAADHERDLAAGALTYDADGSITTAEQDRRTAEHRAKATELDAQAAAL